MEKSKLKPDTDKYRSSAKNKIKDILFSRKNEDQDFSGRFSEDYVNKLAMEIEDELFILFNKVKKLLGKTYQPLTFFISMTGCGIQVQKSISKYYLQFK